MDRDNQQITLQKYLGPEFISKRQGPGGSSLGYIEGWKAIALANDIFGFDGWSHSVTDMTVDFVDVVDNKVSLGISALVRVSLKDGSYHEDIGYGFIENAKSKAIAFEKAKKEAVTDGLKRGLKAFGNVLGNCIYDKEYLKKIGRVPVPPSKPLDPTELHRHESLNIEKPNCTIPQKNKENFIPGPVIQVKVCSENIQKESISILDIKKEIKQEISKPEDSIETSSDFFFDDDLIAADLETMDSALFQEIKLPNKNQKAQGNSNGCGNEPSLSRIANVNQNPAQRNSIRIVERAKTPTREYRLSPNFQIPQFKKSPNFRVAPYKK